MRIKERLRYNRNKGDTMTPEEHTDAKKCETTKTIPAKNNPRNHAHTGNDPRVPLVFVAYLVRLERHLLLLVFTAEGDRLAGDAVPSKSKTRRKQAGEAGFSSTDMYAHTRERGTHITSRPPRKGEAARGTRKGEGREEENLRKKTPEINNENTLRHRVQKQRRIIPNSESK